MKQEEKIKNHEAVKLFKKITGEQFYNSSFCLVGGAIIDILEDRKPKDYDFLGHTEGVINKFIDEGFEYCYETKSAITLRKSGYIVQFLKTLSSSFDFKISQAKYSFKSEKLTIDKLSFSKKILIPVSFDDRRSALSALIRVPHWKRKGYEIHDMTYLSLLGLLGGKSNES